MNVHVSTLVGFVLFSPTWATDENSEGTTFSLFPTTVPRRSPATRKHSDTPEEDIYIEHFGNDRFKLALKTWDTIHHWYMEIDEPKVKELCSKAHVKAGYGEKVRADVVILNLRMLVFRNENYTSRDIDVITYSIEDGATIYEKRRYWYLTEGTRVDCVFYLDPADPKQREFWLKKQVCGIKVF